MNNNCFNCPYINAELTQRLQAYDTDLEFYEYREGEYCWCDKVGGKIVNRGICSEGGIDFIEPSYHMDLNNDTRRGKVYRREQRKKHIKKRKEICHNVLTNHPVKETEDGRRVVDLSQDLPGEWYPHDGMYDKGKIHCNCNICKPYKMLPSEKNERADKIGNLKVKEWEKDEMNKKG